MLVVYWLVCVVVCVAKKAHPQPGHKHNTPSVAHCRCTPLVRAEIMDDMDSKIRRPCVLGPNGNGVCCSTKKSNPARPKRLRRHPHADNAIYIEELPVITDKDIDDAEKEVEDEMRSRDELETKLIKKGLTIRPGSTEDMHHRIVNPDKRARQLGQSGIHFFRAAQKLKRRFDLPREQGDRLRKLNLQNTTLSSKCSPDPTCPETKYRTVDGSCNNNDNARWGMSFTAFIRLMQPAYDDGIDEPRTSKSGSPLPSARLISTTVMPDVDSPDCCHTLMLMNFGQLIDHDLTFTPVYQGKSNTGITCCGPEYEEDPSLQHPECFPISIPKDDPFYSKYHITCMEFVRSLAAPREPCQLGPRVPMNQQTAYIDCSMQYSSKPEDAVQLRTMSGGQLRTSSCNGNPYLPFTDPQMICGHSDVVFDAGDPRVSEVPQLTTFHIILLREHNHIAAELQRCNPTWNDEQLYQQARKIVYAVFQHIIYTEFLPLVLGWQTIEKYGLRLQQSGYSTSYDPTCNAAVSTEFEGAAFRFGHSMIPGFQQLCDADFGSVKTTELSSAFERTDEITDHPLELFIRGLATQKSQRFDNYMSREVTNLLFRGNNSYGLDLVALNIQRGRDQGIRPYNDYREYCGLPRATCFKDLYKDIPKHLVDKLKLVYEDVDDVDLFAAGLCERSLPEAVVGPTFACIIGEQFQRLKEGDRYWYENGGDHAQFSPEQLQEIRKMSLARLFCKNANIERIQPLALFVPNAWNKRTCCDNTEAIPAMNLSKWCNLPEVCK